MAVARPTGPDQADVACRSMKFNDRILLAYPPQHGTLQTEWRVSDAWKICNCTELAGLKQGDISMRARTMADINIVCYGVFVCDSVCVCVRVCVYSPSEALQRQLEEAKFAVLAQYTC